MQYQLVEPAIIADVYASGLAEPEDLEDGNYRLTYFVKQTHAGVTEYIIVARIVLPLSAVIAARADMTKTFGCYCGAYRKLAAN